MLKIKCLVIVFVLFTVGRLLDYWTTLGVITVRLYESLLTVFPRQTVL